MTSVQVNDNCAVPSVKSKPTSAALILYVPKGEERDRIKAVLSQWPGPASDQDRAPVFFRDPETGKCEEIASSIVSARAATTASAVEKLGCRSEYGALVKWGGMFGAKIVSGLSSFVPAPTVPAPAPAPAAPAPVSVSAPAPAAVKPLIGVKAPLTKVPVAVTTEAVVKSYVRAQVLAVSNGEEGRFTISTVDERGQRSDIAIRPTRKANEDGERYHFVAKALSEFFAVALAVEMDMDQALDPGQFVMDPAAKIGGTDLPEGEVYPGGADLPTRKAWLTARQDISGRWCVDELIRAQFCCVRPVALTVDRYDVWPVYTWAVPAPIEVAAVGQLTAEAVALLLARPVSETADGRHVIALSPNIADMRNWCVQYLEQIPTLYQRAGALCEVLDSDDGVSLREVPAAHLDGLISSKIKFTRKTEAGKEKEEVVPARVRDSVMAMGSWPLIRPIVGLTAAPQFRADGTVRTERGYDPTSRVYMTQSVACPPVGETPAEAVAAVQRLMVLLKDFKFTNGPRHRAIWIACLLTRLAREQIEGECPLFAATANSESAGKGLLFDLIARIADDQGQPPNTALKSNPSAFDDELVATLNTGRAMARIDNVPPDKQLDNATLASILTSYPVYDARLKYGPTQATLPTLTVWCVTGINLTMSKELETRALTMEIEIDSANPDEVVKPNIVRMAKSDRIMFLHAALTCLRAWHVAGRPEMETSVSARSSYTAWADVIRQCVLWLASLPGLAGVLSDPVARRVKSEAREESATVIRLWHAAVGATKVGAKRADPTVGVSVAQALRGDAQAHEDLREHLREAVGHDLDPLKVAKYLSRHGQKPTALGGEGEGVAKLMPRRGNVGRTWFIEWLVKPTALAPVLASVPSESVPVPMDPFAGLFTEQATAAPRA